MRETEPDLSHPAYRGVQMTPDDAGEGWHLSCEAGWNQTAEDWRFLLTAGRGFGFEEPGGALAASAVVLPYEGRLAWISMVLVTTTARRQGLATQLLRHALQICARHGWEPWLDATTEGRRVYLSLGFHDTSELSRWSGQGGGITGPAADTGLLRAIKEAAAWDRLCFGVDRRALLGHLLASRPALAFESRDQNGVSAGCCLARAGINATQIGPVFAADEGVALRLLRTALDVSSGPVLIDLAEGHAMIEAELIRRGFSVQRRFTRMVHADGNVAGLASGHYVIAGPEFG